MKNSIIILVALLLGLSSCEKAEKTAFIDLNKVVEEYNVMKNIKEEFKAKEEAFNKKYDSIGRAFQQEYQKFLAKAGRMNPKKAQKLYDEFMAEQQRIGLQQQQEAQQLQQEFEKASEEASEKLKKFIEEYGKSHNFTYIFSRTELSGVAYGKEDKDITDELLDALNNSSGETKK